MVPAQVFSTKDGFAVLFISTDKFWRRFCEIVGWHERINDPKFSTMAARSENRVEVILSQLINENTKHTIMGRTLR